MPDKDALNWSARVMQTTRLTFGVTQLSARVDLLDLA